MVFLDFRDDMEDFEATEPKVVAKGSLSFCLTVCEASPPNCGGAPAAEPSVITEPYFLRVLPCWEPEALATLVAKPARRFPLLPAANFVSRLAASSL